MSDRDDQDRPIEPTPTAATRTVTAKGVILVGARVIAGAAGLVAAATTIAAATLLPLPTHQSTPPSATVIPVPAAQQRACAGPLLRLGDDSGQGATIASAVGSPQVRHAASDGAVIESSIGTTDEPSGRSATVLTLPPTDAAAGSQLLLSGNQTQSVDTGDLMGLAAAECAEARSETWLVGGSTDTGRTTLITLANPGTVIATVDLSIFSPEGEVDAPGTEAIVVQPNSERILSLAGFAPGLISPVVKVESTGGQVVANLQQSTVRILAPGGVDIIGATASPSTENVIPGLVVAGHDLIEPLLATPGFQDINPILRLFVPGEQPAEARITVRAMAPDVADVIVDYELMAGQVTELPLTDFADGSYSVTVNSDVPVVAGARASAIGTTGASDFVWLSSAPVMSDTALVNLAPGPGTVLHLSNPTETDAVVAIEADSGEDLSATVPAGGALAVPVTGSTSYALSGFDRLRIAVSYLGDGVIAGFTLSPTGPASKPITVFP